MTRPAPTGLAADYRAKLGDLGVRTPVRAASDAPGWILGADGSRVAGVAMASLGLEAAQALKLAEALAAAINWYAGLERQA